METSNSHNPAGRESPNKLGDESSPYLQQHKYNLVDWFPWGEDAFKKAKDEDKIIFLSIGYSTCHWCHVMERESFNSPEISKFLNKREGNATGSLFDLKIFAIINIRLLL